MNPTYDVSGVLPDDTVDELPAGKSLLIDGPPMIGKRRLAIQLLGTGHEKGDGILCVTTSDDAGSLLDEFEAEIPSLDRNRVGIVDCSGGNQQRKIAEIATETVSSPGDLTGISIGTAKLLQKFSTKDVSAIRHGLVSVSTLIKYLDPDTVFKFIHIYTARIADTGGIGIFTIDNAAHDPQTLSTITSEFDGVIELRETADGERQLRVKGFPAASRTWHPF